MSAARQHDRLAQSGNELRQGGKKLVHAAEGDDEIAVACDIEGGDSDLLAREGRQQLPIAIDVAIPVEAAAKTGARKLAGVEIDVGFR